MIAIAIGGFLGAIARYGFYWVAESRSKHPKLATWFVNSSGSFAIGALIGAGNQSAFWLTGFLGAFTTFSTMALDAVKDFEDGKWLRALGYLTATLISGIMLFSAAFALF
ncbi:fluoride efflux transporter FluC [Planococcus shenhongbingii]|uniref:Fluoride-specific ion channel FluC n=1 Tax=Planococcus shenhongbingii TaxID=3058398 RepID=A0ABT8NFI3_9BACL|nr:CrcB family protein [Planococcus sp. N017]MDN7246591.1 CrcB family protein [Planococcus sp. N017]